ncbi:MAG: di-heme oxidoredictase family protein, partial [Litorivicinus sp.]
YSQFLSTVRGQELTEAVIGDALFKKNWASSPSSTPSSDGLGPLFNARSCQACHVKDGRGRRPVAGGFDPTLLIKFGTPDRDFGSQLQTESVAGIPSEGRYRVDYQSEFFAYPDGDVLELQRPVWTLPPGAPSNFTLRMAPPVYGLGLIDSIDRTDAPELGYGWRGQNGSLRAQIQDAAFHDMGLGNARLSQPFGDCTETQTACRDAPNGNDSVSGLELTEQMESLMLSYLLSLSPPAARNPSGAGRALFEGAGCAGCHRPSYMTRADAPLSALASQRIWPYSDFARHDMGDDLADPSGDRAWRTPPLWGVGYAFDVNPQAGFLHDGRARTLEEAVVWHGGAAEPARDAFAALTKAQRVELLGFIESL